MKKLKIIGMSSEDYPGGRIDSFEIELLKESPHHSHLIPSFLDLGFPKEIVLDKLDRIIQEMEYMFIYGSPKIKAYVDVAGGILLIRFDTSFPRRKIIDTMNKYFEFPK